MTSKTTKIVVSIMVVILLGISLLGFYFYNNGFKILTYATDNYLKDQIKDILASESGDDFKGKVEEIEFKKFGDDYLGFFYIDNSEENQCLIAKYKECFNLGEKKVLNLNKVIEGSNSVAMMELSSVEGDSSSYVILMSNEEDKFGSINIVSDDGEVIDNIELSDEGIAAKNGEEVTKNIYAIEYTPEENQKINIELVMKSE